MANYSSHCCGFNGTLLEVVVHNRTMHVSDGHEVTTCCICNAHVQAHVLRKHIRRYHPNDCTVQCTACNEPFVADVDMHNHLRNACKVDRVSSFEPMPHMPRIWPCDLCSKHLRMKGGVETHKKVVHGITSCGYSQPSFTPRLTIPADMNKFLNRCGPGDVNKYIAQHLQTDETFRDECSSVVDRIADFFKRRSGYTVDRFIKGGSLGKGTAIKSKSDIDCVMFISELPPIDDEDDSDEDYFDKLQDCLKKMEKILRASSVTYNLEVVDRTRYAVKLRVQTKKADHEPHDVDLLPAKDLLGPAPTSAKKEKVYAMMGGMSSSVRENCSAALVELQRDFVKKQPAEVKDLIRLVKMWKASCVTESSLTSYPLELLCIQTWPSYRSVAAAFKAVLQKLSAYSSICAYWTENYSYSRVLQMTSQRPLILDPANPYNNVADRCRDWPAVARTAQQTLRKPFFSSC